MYRIMLHQFVLKKDFPKIPKGDQRKITKAIYKKLSHSPEIFGKPLAAELKGYFRLRVDSYRVIYRVEKEKIVVFIILVGLRKDLIAYIEAAKRIKLI